MTQAQEVNGRMLDVASAQTQALAGQGALLLHRVYPIGFKSKITTVISWTVTSLSARRGQLTITEQRAGSATCSACRLPLKDCRFSSRRFPRYLPVWLCSAP
jgi:hypothetical protein